MGVPERLRDALGAGPEKRSIRWVHNQLVKTGVLDAAYSTVHRYFSGETPAPVTFLQDAASLLGVSAAWLATGEGSMVPKGEDWVVVLRRAVEEECPAFADGKPWTSEVWLMAVSISLSAARIQGFAGTAVADKESDSRALGRILQMPFTELGIDPEKLPPWSLDLYATNMCLALMALLDPPEKG